MTERSYVVRRDVDIPMGDGTVLRADVYLPGDGRHPVLLQRLPYDKSSSIMSQHMVGMDAVRALDEGFALVIQDTRGRWSSDGVFDAFVDEERDGADTIAWIRQQPFSNGHVGMYGASYIGATQMLAARANPDGLDAIAPMLTASEYYNNWTYRGGALQLGFVLLWILETLGGPDLARMPDGPDKDVAAELLDRMMRSPEVAYEALPVWSDALIKLAPYAEKWLGHATSDEFWSRIDPSKKFASMDVAGLHIGGWNDIFVDGTLANFEGLTHAAASEAARRNQYLIIGPWSHGNITAWQGDGWHGYAGEAVVFNLVEAQLEFFSALLKGEQHTIPKVRVFTSGADRWDRYDAWPPPGISTQTWYLSADNTLALDDVDPGELSYVSDTLNPVPTVGGATFLPGLLVARNSGPKDQASIEVRDDVLVFDSPILDADVHVAGEVTSEVTGSTTGADCDWVVRLCDVHPDGRSVSVVDGIVRIGSLGSSTSGTWPVTLGSTSHVFRVGHRMRVHIASSNFPRFDRNPQSGTSSVHARSDDFEVATQTVSFGGPTPTQVRLPIVGAH